MDFNFIKIAKNETPKPKGSNRSYFDEDSLHLNLVANEVYCLYFKTEEDIISVDSIILVDSNTGEIDIFNNCTINKVLNKWFHLTFNFPFSFSRGCQQLKFIINNNLTYLSSKFLIRDYNNEDTILLNWWHKENKNTIPYFDFQDEIYYTQRLHVNLRFISKYDEFKSSSAEDTINRDYHLIGSYRSIEIPLEFYKNYTSIEHHQSLARALTSDFVYFGNQRFKIKKYDFKEDEEERGIVEGKIEAQLIEDDLFNFDADLMKSNLRMLKETQEDLVIGDDKFQDYFTYANYIHTSPVTTLSLENKLYFSLGFYFNQYIDFVNISHFFAKLNDFEILSDDDNINNIYVDVSSFLASEGLLKIFSFNQFFNRIKQNDFNVLTFYKNKIKNISNIDLYFGRTIKFYVKRPPNASIVQFKVEKDTQNNRFNFILQEEIFDKFKIDFCIILIYENNTLIEIKDIYQNNEYFDGFTNINNSFKFEIYLLKRLGISEEKLVINL